VGPLLNAVPTLTVKEGRRFVFNFVGQTDNLDCSLEGVEGASNVLEVRKGAHPLQPITVTVTGERVQAIASMERMRK